MFEGDTNIGLLNTARANQSQSNRNARQADLNLEAMYEWRDHAQALERENAALRARVAELEARAGLLKSLREAENEALGTVTLAWRAANPASPMHDVVGTLSSGRPMKRNLRTWMVAFDEAARQRGITNPEAYRIS